MTSFFSLSKELGAKILALVTVSSFGDLFQTKLCCKVFFEVSEENYVYQHVSLDKFPIVPWHINNKISKFLRRSIQSKNSEALYRKGMDSQEQFFKEHVKIIYNARDAKEDDFQKIQQEQRQKITQQSHANPPSARDLRVMGEAIAKSIKLQDKEMEEFISQREKLMKAHKERMSEMKNRHLQEELALKRKQWEKKLAIEREFNIEESKLMEKYTPTELIAGQ